MSDLVEELAKVLYAVWGNPKKWVWDKLPQHTRDVYREQARAALAHLNIPAGSGPVNVGEAVELARRVLERQGCNKTCDYGGYPHCEHAAGVACSNMLRAREIWAVLRALGSEVD